ncbi:hypothetical protein [Poseidonocella sp. HB161398]|uniref:hypothetical protein n=1 Tax=Poseidonocella sp. HB161398 TaxID=2320855 RepID=UPI001107ED56|nr:hypothetical protein [Poseidonocella sp. HB161398]
MKHETLFDGMHLAAGPRSKVIEPTLLRYDLGPALVEDLYADLRAEDWRERLGARADLERRGGVPLVDQGVHRKAVLVLLEAACLVPGFPRLDPAKVTQAAMVVRREKDGVTEGWLSDARDRPLGWKPLPPEALGALSDYDPDRVQRRARLTGANPVLRRKETLTGDSEGITETVHPLFAIPPDIAAQLGRSLWFAVLPTGSRAIAPVEAPPPPFEESDTGERMPNLLRHERNANPLPPTGSTITLAAFRAASGDPALDGVAGLRSTLAWLAQETGVFTGEPYAAELKAQLGAVALEGGGTLFGWLEGAHAALVLRSDGAGDSVQTPESWPAISETRFKALRAASFAAMAARWSLLSPAVSRFGPVGDRYSLRCFLRLDDCPGCPPRMLWSPLSRSYTIRPWYESGGAPPAQIELPSLTPEALKNIKPDVAIKVPPEIQKFMDKLNMQDLLDGKRNENTSISFGMICGFSIPIITICAFIVLSIFLSLLNLLFFWLPFIKICIPYPIISTSEEDS